MGHKAIIYGRINSRNGENISVYNRRILEEIPDLDDTWPFLTRHMFGTAEEKVGACADRGIYKSLVIHFGASLKDEPNENAHWNDWLIKFELLLNNLVWLDAKVYIETDFSKEKLYLYKSDWQLIQEKLDQNLPSDIFSNFEISKLSVSELKSIFYGQKIMYWSKELLEMNK